MKNPHPLLGWIAKNKTTIPDFARKAKMPFKVLYEQLNGAKLNPHLATLRRIERATKGAVSIQSQADWLKTREGRVVPKRKRGRPRKVTAREAAEIEAIEGVADEYEDVDGDQGENDAEAERSANDPEFLG